jgi:hypothetical protein
MQALVNLVSQNQGELKNFLDFFFEKDTKIDPDVSEWISTYKDPLEVIDLIAAVVDNSDTYNIDTVISLDENLFVSVSEKNLNDIIKFILFRFYAPEAY